MHGCSSWGKEEEKGKNYPWSHSLPLAAPCNLLLLLFTAKFLYVVNVFCTFFSKPLFLPLPLPLKCLTLVCNGPVVKCRRLSLDLTLLRISTDTWTSLLLSSIALRSQASSQLLDLSHFTLIILCVISLTRLVFMRTITIYFFHLISPALRTEQGIYYMLLKYLCAWMNEYT